VSSTQEDYASIIATVMKAVRVLAATGLPLKVWQRIIDDPIYRARILEAMGYPVDEHILDAAEFSMDIRRRMLRTALIQSPTRPTPQKLVGVDVGAFVRDDAFQELLDRLYPCQREVLEAMYLLDGLSPTRPQVARSAKESASTARNLQSAYVALAKFMHKITESEHERIESGFKLPQHL
jgi:hypothetical protein